MPLDQPVLTPLTSCCLDNQGLAAIIKNRCAAALRYFTATPRRQAGPRPVSTCNPSVTRAFVMLDVKTDYKFGHQ